MEQSVTRAVIEPAGFRNSPRAVIILILSTVLVACAGCQSSARPAIATGRLPATQPVQSADLPTAKDLFYNTVAGDLNSLAPSLQILNQLGGGNSSHPQVVAYTGAATLLKASRASLLEKGQLAHDGLALEDKAVAEAPNDLEVRFLRGVTCYKLPKFMGRSAMAASDLAYVAKAAEQAVHENRLDRRAAAADLLYHGKVREENYDEPAAEAAWRAALRIDPDSAAARDAMKHLAEHHLTP